MLASPFAEDSTKLSSIVSHLPSVHHNRSKRPRRLVEEPTIPMMSGINDMFSDNQYLQNPSSITMSLPIQSIPVNQSMIPLQQLPMSLGPVISTTQPVNQLSQFIQSVDPLVLEQS